jgi:hypothetical protein
MLFRVKLNMALMYLNNTKSFKKRQTTYFRQNFLALYCNDYVVKIFVITFVVYEVFLQFYSLEREVSREKSKWKIDHEIA